MSLERNRTCSIKNCVNFIVRLFLLSQLTPSTFVVVATCSGPYNKCQTLSECKIYQVNAVDFSSLNWCDPDNAVVCCPQPRINNNPVEIERRSGVPRPFATDCRKWRQQIYPVCQPEGLIVGGIDSAPKELPHMALLGKEVNEKIKWLCGGSLISPRYVITASHCTDLDGDLSHVRLGDLNYNSTDDDAEVQEFRIKNFISYPDFDGDNEFDIALVELDGIARINSYVVPICLPAIDDKVIFHERLYAAGWGQLGQTEALSAMLKKVHLEKFQDINCSGTFPSVNLQYQFCAGSYVDRRDTCNGDSGGPLFIESKENSCMFELQGITSYGLGCGKAGIPSVYSRVYPYLDWIENIVWKNGRK